MYRVRELFLSGRDFYWRFLGLLSGELMQKHWKRELEIWKHGLRRDLAALCQCTCARDWVLTAFILPPFALSTFKLTKVFIIDLFYGKIIKDFYGPNTNFKYFQGLKTDCYNSRVLKTCMNEPWYTLTDCYTPTKTDPRKGSWGVGVLEPSTPIFLLKKWHSKVCKDQWSAVTAAL